MLNNTAFNVHIGEEVAIKLESVKSKSPQLLRETKIYRSLNGIGEIMHACMLATIQPFTLRVIPTISSILHDLSTHCTIYLSIYTLNNYLTSIHTYLINSGCSECALVRCRG